MRTRTLAASLSAALVLTGGALAGAEEVEEPSDGNDIEFSLLYRDAEGDATAFVVEEVMPVSEDTLDLTEGEIGFDHETATLVFRLGVLDLSPLPPAGATGKTFYVNFAMGGRDLWVTATDDLTTGTSFGLGGPDPDTGLRSTFRSDLEGEFDYDGNVIEVRLPSSMVEELDLAPLEPGVRFSGTGILAQRLTTAGVPGVVRGPGFTPTADGAVARSFTIPEPPEAEEPVAEEDEESSEG
jgi:hypothetical protein